MYIACQCYCYYYNQSLIVLFLLDDAAEDIALYYDIAPLPSMDDSDRYDANNIRTKKHLKVQFSKEPIRVSTFYVFDYLMFIFLDDFVLMYYFQVHFLWMYALVLV